MVELLRRITTLLERSVLNRDIGVLQKFLAASQQESYAEPIALFKLSVFSRD